MDQVAPWRVDADRDLLASTWSKPNRGLPIGAERPAAFFLMVALLKDASGDIFLFCTPNASLHVVQTSGHADGYCNGSGTHHLLPIEEDSLSHHDRLHFAVHTVGYCHRWHGPLLMKGETASPFGMEVLWTPLPLHEHTDRISCVNGTRSIRTLAQLEKKICFLLFLRFRLRRTISLCHNA